VLQIGGSRLQPDVVRRVVARQQDVVNLLEAIKVDGNFSKKKIDPHFQQA
jgi:hypothetical protein